MSRVQLVYDDDSKIDFADVGDALFHLTRQGVSGVRGLKDEAGKSVLTRAQLEARVKQAAQDGLTEPDDIRNLA